MQALSIKTKHSILIDFFKQKIFNSGFDKLWSEIFKFQVKNNKVYSNYLKNLNLDVEKISNSNQLVFLPVEFFKNQIITTLNDKSFDFCFESSSTTGKGVSKHFVSDIEFYKLTTQKCLEYFYGDIKNFNFRFLLPSYSERKNSSLIYMSDFFCKLSGNGGYYLNNYDDLINDLRKDKKNGKKSILFGVSFALLDFAEKFEIDLSDVIVMETGGMKGRRKEITSFEIHDFLKKRFNLSNIHSEYGMTELFSQAYSKGNGKYECPPWMKVIITELNDPFAIQTIGKTGIINVIDLANIYSCCFISTSDIGKLNDDGTFEILGRADFSDIRGCSLLFE